MKSCALAARAAATTSASLGVGPPEAQVVLDRAVEQIGVLRHHGDHPAHRIRIERAQVLAADADRAGLRIVQAQQQPHDGGLAGAAGTDHADALAGGDAERQALVRAHAGRRDRRSCTSSKAMLGASVDTSRRVGRRGWAR